MLPLTRTVQVSVLAALAAACATTPALRSPLREQLAKSDTSTVEQATRACLKNAGWKVDPVGGLSGGANVVTAFKAKDQTDVYIYPAETSPRITGGPDYADGFWLCLGHELGSASAGGGEGTDSDKGPHIDPADKPPADKPPKK
jgi:hypothetical protein